MSNFLVPRKSEPDATHQATQTSIHHRSITDPSQIHHNESSINMCLYPKLIRNPKYLPNKKNGGHPPVCKDKRLLYIPVGCGKCMECRKQLANSWRIRMSEELNKNHGIKKPYMVMLSFDEESLQWFRQSCNTDEECATAAVRMFLERWRAKWGKSLRHWLVTEHGHEGTERIHLHGIVWCTRTQIQDLNDRWGYGYTGVGQWVNMATINYIVKYVTKMDERGFVPKILCSAGLGNNYIEQGKRYNAWAGEHTREHYRDHTGNKRGMPMYYRQRIWSDDEREKLWLLRLDQHKRYVDGVEIDVSTYDGIRLYYRHLREARKKSERLGYIVGKKNTEKQEKIYKKNLLFVNNF